MKISVKLFDKTTDYTTLVKWCEGRKITALPAEFLSDYGVMVSIDDTKVASSFLYPQLGVNFAMIKFPIANPEATKEQRDVALNECFESLHGIAKGMGYSYVFCPTDVKSLQNRLTNIFNYTETNQNCKCYWSDITWLG